MCCCCSFFFSLVYLTFLIQLRCLERISQGSQLDVPWIERKTHHLPDTIQLEQWNFGRGNESQRQQRTRKQERNRNSNKIKWNTQSVDSFVVIDSVAAVFHIRFGWVHHFEPPARSYLIRSIGSAIYFMIIVLIRPISCVYFVNFVHVFLPDTHYTYKTIGVESTYIYSHICLLAYPQYTGI